MHAVLGDLVGYGADPNAVIDCVQRLNPLSIVRGNHDKVACGLEQAEGFNAVAKSAAKWTLEVLTPEYREWLAVLPEGPIEVDDTLLTWQRTLSISADPVRRSDDMHFSKEGP